MAIFGKKLVLKILVIMSIVPRKEQSGITYIELFAHIVELIRICQISSALRKQSAPGFLDLSYDGSHVDAFKKKIIGVHWSQARLTILKYTLKSSLISCVWNAATGPECILENH